MFASLRGLAPCLFSCSDQSGSLWLGLAKKLCIFVSSKGLSENNLSLWGTAGEILLTILLGMRNFQGKSMCLFPKACWYPQGWSDVSYFAGAAEGLSPLCTGGRETRLSSLCWRYSWAAHLQFVAVPVWWNSFSRQLTERRAPSLLWDFL